MKTQRIGRPPKYRCPECRAKGVNLRLRYKTQTIFCRKCSALGSMTSSRWSTAVALKEKEKEKSPSKEKVPLKVPEKKEAKKK